MNNNIHIIKDNDFNIAYLPDCKKIFEISDSLLQDINQSVIDESLETKGLIEFNKYVETLPSYKLRNPRKSTRLHRISFLSTQACNLRCTYCFANEGTYNDKTASIMSVDIYKRVFEYLYENYEDGINLVQFFGGEPLIGFNEIKEAVDICIEIAKEKDVAVPVFAIVTNGTMFTKDSIDFFNKYKLQVIVSIDGPKNLNDLTRVSKNYYSVYDEIETNLKVVNENREFNLFAEMTLNQNHINNYSEGEANKWIKDIKDLGFDGVIVGVVDTDIDALKIKEKDRDVFYKLYQEIVDNFFNTLKKGNDYFACPDIFGLVMSIIGNDIAFPCGAGYNNLAADTKGNIYPCYQFCSNSQHKMAELKDVKIIEEDNHDEIQNDLMDIIKNRPSECNDCWLNTICSVWCRGMSFNRFGNVSQISDPRCWIMETAVENTIRNLNQLSKDPTLYKTVVQNMIRMSKKYSYDK